MPNPVEKRAPWYQNTAPTYAGIFLWFAFWDPISKFGLAKGGLVAALIGIVAARLRWETTMTWDWIAERLQFWSRRPQSE